MAPPMAAAVLGQPGFTVAELVEEVAWPEGVDVGLVETAGGVRSPQADDGDAVDMVRALAPDLVLLVADAGLGTINAVRLSVDALTVEATPPVARGADRAGLVTGSANDSIVVVLNRYDGANDLHQGNRYWLIDRDGLRVVTIPGEEQTLVALVRGM